MRKNENIDNFRQWLVALPVNYKPSLKVNGNGYSTAVVVVDFGTPKEGVRLTSEQNSELGARMKELTTTLTGRRSVRVGYDNNAGVYWTSI
jgi:hypothetical protein